MSTNPLVGTEVEVYRNLHSKCWSIRDRRTGLVVAHAAAVTLRDAEFRVSEGGRQRVLRERRKNVHAVVRGTLMARTSVRYHELPRARYNPYEAGYFTDAGTGERVDTARRVLLTVSGNVFYQPALDRATAGV